MGAYLQTLPSAPIPPRLASPRARSPPVSALLDCMRAFSLDNDSTCAGDRFPARACANWPRPAFAVSYHPLSRHRARVTYKMPRIYARKVSFPSTPFQSKSPVLARTLVSAVCASGQGRELPQAARAGETRIHARPSHSREREPRVAVCQSKNPTPEL